MEEKKKIKISLSTFFLILSIIAICVMGVFIYKINNDKIIADNEILELKDSINKLEEAIRTNADSKTTVNSIKQNETITTNTVNTTDTNNTDTDSNKKDIIELSDIKYLVKGLRKYDYLRIKELKKDGDSYIAKVDYLVPTAMSQKELSEIVKNKKVILNKKEYIFDNSKNVYNIRGYGYAYMEGENPDNGYWVEKNNDGYIFIHEIGGVYDIINHVEESFTIKLDGNMEIYYVATGDESETVAEFVEGKKDITQGEADILYFDNNYHISYDMR